MNEVRIVGLMAGAYEDLTIDDTEGGVGFTSTKRIPTTGSFLGVPCQNVFCTIDYNDEDIRFTIDGTVPTATVGHLLRKGGILELDNGSDVKNFRAIQVSAPSTLRITYKYFRRA
jgi:hypothetical protein